MQLLQFWWRLLMYNLRSFLRTIRSSGNAKYSIGKVVNMSASYDWRNVTTSVSRVRDVCLTTFITTLNLCPTRRCQRERRQCGKLPSLMTTVVGWMLVQYSYARFIVAAFNWRYHTIGVHIEFLTMLTDRGIRIDLIARGDGPLLTCPTATQYRARLIHFLWKESPSDIGSYDTEEFL